MDHPVITTRKYIEIVQPKQASTRTHLIKKLCDKEYQLTDLQTLGGDKVSTRLLPARQREDGRHTGTTTWASSLGWGGLLDARRRDEHKRLHVLSTPRDRLQLN
jgi:hypothetical protein